MADAYEFDPFENNDLVEEDEETLRILDERCEEIDQGRVKMLSSEDALQRTEEWLSRLSTRQQR
ncbi:MAG TPA: hypothetical protein VFA65_20255 [Bryobacteraceae bacterium]|nr:hypothetical protein [Bryobacteraceae bacterium]